MHSFTIPRTTADRLSRLPLACADESGPLGHIGVRVTPTAVRFAATNGRLLASLLVSHDQPGVDASDLILDADQFTAAMKSAAKGNASRITIEISTKEVRCTCGAASTIVRRVEGFFPHVEHVWTRPNGMRWVPTMSSLDPLLLGVAQKISGHRQPLLFSSPVDPAAGLDRLWAVPGALPSESVALTALRAAVGAPAYWSDHEMAVLIMPVTRSADGRQPDVAAHAVAQPATALAA